MPKLAALVALRALCAAAPADLPDESLRLLAAHSALETGGWRSMPLNNFGGLKGKGALLWTTERINGLLWQVQRSFRIYATPEIGARAFVRTLKTPRYHVAWKILTHTASPGYYAKALRRAGYFTASATAYGRALARWQKSFRAKGISCTKSLGSREAIETDKKPRIR